MASNEKFCLKWNDFEHNVSSAFDTIREEKDFFDVTLVCDNKQVEKLNTQKIYFRIILFAGGGAQSDYRRLLPILQVNPEEEPAPASSSVPQGRPL